ncbi:hypothetical protein [Qaidamihabitans albus]|uniref:hypothetical protein n=1 Tax=Qaidamihabitans albus TaxID=2795733 RepID=UPI0018F22EBC|nr:hypothetical protein [Qaidamihabitans albus]
MATTAATERSGAERARRWWSRALVVVGGALAGTAAAWALATATAAAAPSSGHDTFTGPAVTAVQHGENEGDLLGETTGVDVTPVADATVDGLGRVVSGAAGLTGDVSAAVPATGNGEGTGGTDTGKAKDAGETEATEATEATAQTHGTEPAEVDRAVTRFCDEALLRPAHKTLGAVEQAVRSPRDAKQIIERGLTPSKRVQDFGEKVWDAFAPGAEDLVDLPELPALPGADDSTGPLPGALPDAAPATGAAPQTAPAAMPSVTQNDAFALNAMTSPDSLADAAADSQRSGDAGKDSTPVSPVRPLAPLAMPAPAGGTAGGFHVDGPLFGVPANSLAASYDAVHGSIRAGVRHLPIQPGSQPGVTPD